MIVSLLCFSIFAVPSVLSGVAKEITYSCSLNEYACSDGACVSAELICDGQQDCADGSDEMGCAVNGLQLPYGETVLNRSKRQSNCRKNQWQCRDGTCIQFDGKCDGIVDCADGSDETHALCWKNKCQSNWFRCTYGACVDGTAPCNHLQECADNSDELLPRCRNETDEIRGQFKCLDGTSIPASNHCDGVKDCPDGSDETLRTCAGKTCPSYLFQCAYGACVDSGADCNKVQDCADNSDESEELCAPRTGTATIRPTFGNCVLPPYPEHGTYTTNINNASPGMSYREVTVNVTCHRGFGVEGGINKIPCRNGQWDYNIPKCVRQCQLNPHPSVEYTCLVFGAIRGERACNYYEPEGTIVRPSCRKPNYYQSSELTNMQCIDGYWSYVARCKPECGTPTPESTPLVFGGGTVKKGELPWHAGIYTKSTIPYRQECGGSLISNKIVISAAHCFWTELEKTKPASNFAVAVGKIYLPWGDTHDTAQKSDVQNIHLPPRYQGSLGNFQDDIALVIVVEAFIYQTFVRPVCLNFDPEFEKQQLQPSNNGTVAGWGLTSADGKAAPILQAIRLPYVDVDTCIENSPYSFRSFITSDKICAGTTEPNSALCKGDSGGGLAFPTLEFAVQRYYLRGIVSTAPKNEHLCNTAVYTSFTKISKHETFIKQFWTDSY